MAVTPIPNPPVVPQYPALGSLTFNQEAYAYGTAMPGVTQRIHEIALASKANAEEAKAQAELAADQVGLAEDQVQLATTQVELATDQVGLAADQVGLATVQANAASAAANRAESARDRAVQAEAVIEQVLVDGPVLQVNGHSGIVNLQAQDIPGLAEFVRLNRVQVTANTALGAGQLAKFLDCKGAITLSVPSPAALGAGWYCYLRNTGNEPVTVGI